MKADITKNFEYIYQEHGDAIFRFCLVRVSNREQALDITQDTFLRLWQSLNKKQDILNNRAFLFTIAHRLIIDWYRKKKSLSLESIKTGDEGDATYDIPDEKTLNNLESTAEGRFLIDKIDELTETSRHSIYLRFVEGLSPQEIGDVLGISANAASVRINRGLAELREKTGYGRSKNENNK
jgi:RNA polymerase sigma-70 factor (ECF subfamily)